METNIRWGDLLRKVYKRKFNLNRESEAVAFFWKRWIFPRHFRDSTIFSKKEIISFVQLMRPRQITLQILYIKLKTGGYQAFVAIQTITFPFLNLQKRHSRQYLMKVQFFSFFFTHRFICWVLFLLFVNACHSAYVVSLKCFKSIFVHQYCLDLLLGLRCRFTLCENLAVAFSIYETRMPWRGNGTSFH